MFIRRTAAFVAIAAVLSLTACGAPPAQPPMATNDAQVPELDAATREYLEFWWQKGSGAHAQHAALVLVSTSGTSFRYVIVDLEKPDDGWRQLYRKPSTAVNGLSRTVTINGSVYAAGEELMKRRIDEELGGTAKHLKVGREQVPLSSGRKVDVVVAAAALVIFPEEAPVEARDRILDSIVFASAAARAEEDSTGSGSAYSRQWSGVLQNIGWVSSSMGAATLGTDELLAESLSKEVEAQGLFRTLGLLRAE